jgi:tetrahydromethanopterin S-methyltransferase subunit D
VVTIRAVQHHMTAWRGLVLLLLLLPGIASAQDTPTKRDTAVAKLNTGQQIRISGEAMNRLIGKAGVALNDTLDFAQDDAVRRIPVQSIDTLWTRGRATTTGMVIGGVAGALLGAYGGAVVSIACEYDCGSEGGTVVAVSALGMATGAAVGALIGAAIPKWKRRYP